MKMRTLGITLTVAALSGCSGDGGMETFGTVQVKQALDIPGLLPVPCYQDGDDPPEIIWDGNQVQLMVADAFAECAYVTGGSSGPVATAGEDYWYGDDYMKHVAELMTSVTDDAVNPPYPLGVAGSWRHFRERSALLEPGYGSCDLAGSGAMEPVELSEDYRFLLGMGETATRGFRQINVPRVNLCVAMRLREQS